MKRSTYFLFGLSLVAGGLVFACSSTDEGSGSAESEVNGECKVLSLPDAGGADAAWKAEIGPYCPFQGPDASVAKACNAGQICCNPGSGNGDAYCQDADAGACTFATADAGTTWACDSNDQCGDGEVCCVGATIYADTKCPGQVKASKARGTACRKTCATGELEVCTAASECEGKVCTPFLTNGRQLGYCGGVPDAGATDGGKKDGGSWKDAGGGVKKDAGTSKDGGAVGVSDGDEPDEEDDADTTTDAGKKAVGSSGARIAQSNQSGCAAAPGTTGEGGLAALGLALGVGLVVSRRRARRA